MNLSFTRITGEGLSILQGKLNNLEKLDLDSCEDITDQGMMELLQICGTELKFINLSHTQISGEGLSSLEGKLINLEELNLSYCPDITD